MNCSSATSDKLQLLNVCRGLLCTPSLATSGLQSQLRASTMQCPSLRRRNRHLPC
uniref:Uncharacterized protein n=1 Tax=Arundo donax TaxID=35708 RepID=A0A0A8Z6M8_ARUDO